jgi:secernin
VIRTGTYAISNQPTIRTEWDQASQDLIDHAIEAGWWPTYENLPFDFARAYTDPGTPLQVSHVRLQRSRHLLADAARDGKIAFDQATRVLRDHYEDTFLGGPYFTAALPDLMTLCMHDSPAGFTWETPPARRSCSCPTLPTSSHICGGRPPHPARASISRSSPQPRACRMAWLFPQRPLEPSGPSTWQWLATTRSPTGGNSKDSLTTSQETRSLDVQRPAAPVRQAFDPLQQRWAEELPDIQREAVTFIQAGNPQGRKLLTQFTERCARQALEICTNLIAEFDGKMPIA